MLSARPFCQELLRSGESIQHPAQDVHLVFALGNAWNCQASMAEANKKTCTLLSSCLITTFFGCRSFTRTSQLRTFRRAALANGSSPTSPAKQTSQFCTGQCYVIIISRTTRLYCMSKHVCVHDMFAHHILYMHHIYRHVDQRTEPDDMHIVWSVSQS